MRFSLSRAVFSGLLVLFSASLLPAAPALAQSGAPATSPARPSGDVERMAHDDCSRARALGKTCVLTIGPEEVEGGVIRPEGEVLPVRPLGQMGSLIRLRRDFIPEILKSAAQVE